MRRTSDRSNSCITAGLGPYLAALRTRKYSPRTLSVYERAVRDFGAFLCQQGLEQLCDVDSGVLNKYRAALRDRDFAPESVSVYLRALKGFFAFLEQEQEVFLNPLEGMRLSGHRRRLLPTPSEADVGSLLSQPDVSTSLGVRDRAILETLYGTGIRRGELLRLKVRDIGAEKGTLRVMGKGGKERVVPLGREALHWLDRYVTTVRPALLGSGIEPVLWIGSRGQPLSYHALPQILRCYALQAGLRHVSAHALRRACATHMLHKGASPAAIQLLLGHSSMRHLGQYLGLSIRDLQHAHKRSKPGL